MKKKILFVIGSLGSGGAERSLVNLLNALQSDKYEIDLLLFNKSGALVKQVPEYVNWAQTGKEIDFLSSGIKNGKVFHNFTAKSALLRLKYMVSKFLKKPKSFYNQNQRLWNEVWNKCVPQLPKSYDIAVAYIQGIPSYYVIDKVQAKRKILWVHTDYSKLEADHSFDSRYFENADDVITISELCKEALAINFPNIKEKFKVLFNINSTALIRDLANQLVPEEYLSVKKNKVPIILSIGRLNRVKGFDIAINAAALLKEKNIDFTWFVIGEGTMRKELQEQIKKNELEDNVILLGLRNNPYPYIKKSDLVVQSSRYEGKSIVIDEAKILCKPIVSTNYRSALDQIEDGVSGILVDISSKAIAEGIEKLLKNKILQERLAKNLSDMENGTERELEKYLECFEGKLI